MRVVLAARMIQVEVALVGKVALPDLFLRAMRILVIAATQVTMRWASRLLHTTAISGTARRNASAIPWEETAALYCVYCLLACIAAIHHCAILAIRRYRCGAQRVSGGPVPATPNSYVLSNLLCAGLGRMPLWMQVVQTHP